MKKYVSILLRLVFAILAVGVVYWTVRRTDADLVNILLASRWQLLVLAVLIYGGMQILAGWRWKGLLAVQGMSFSMFEMLRLTLVGGFFSLLLPGAVSGDVFKVAFAATRYSGKKTGLVLSVLIDRAVGVCGMFFAGLLALLMAWRQMVPLFVQSWYVRVTVLVAVAGCIGLPFLFCVLKWMSINKESHSAQARWGRIFTAAVPEKVRMVLGTFSRALEIYSRNGGTLAKALSVSVCIHLLHAGVLFICGRALRETVLSPIQYNVVMQLSNVTSLVPCFPGGIGLRDFVASELMGTFGGGMTAADGCVPVVYTMILVFWGIAGAFLWCCSPGLRRVKLS